MEECTELRTEINKKDVAIAKHHEKYVLVFSVGSPAGLQLENSKRYLRVLGQCQSRLDK